MREASAELDALKLRLAAEEAEALRRRRLDRSGQSAHFKAGCVVWIMAILEELIRQVGEELRAEVLSRCAVPDVVHQPLTMALSQGLWQAAALPGREALVRRIELVTTHTMGTDEWPASFSFLDGKTINDRTFTTMWSVLRLDGPAFANPAQSATLRDLAGRRNRVAHGEETVLQAGRSLTFGDLSKKLDHVDDLVSQLYLAIDRWLASGGWRP